MLPAPDLHRKWAVVVHDDRHVAQLKEVAAGRLVIRPALHLAAMLEPVAALLPPLILAVLNSVARVVCRICLDLLLRQQQPTGRQGKAAGGGPQQTPPAETMTPPQCRSRPRGRVRADRDRSPVPLLS